MPDNIVAAVRRAYEAYTRGDVAGMMALVDPDLEWTHLDPALADPAPQVCHGRDELKEALQRRVRRGHASTIEEIAASGDRVMVVVYTPGIDAHRARKAQDRNYDVVTVRHGRIAALRACHDRMEAARVAGVQLRTVRVEFLWAGACPARHAARGLLESAMLARGLDPADVVEVEVNAFSARPLRFCSSPTILIDGVDIEPGFADAGTYALSCRLYPTSYGLTSVPELDWMERALDDALRAG